MKDFYSILGLNDKATEEEIKKTYTDAMNEISKIKKQYNGIVKFG